MTDLNYKFFLSPDTPCDSDTRVVIILYSVADRIIIILITLTQTLDFIKFNCPAGDKSHFHLEEHNIF